MLIRLLSLVACVVLMSCHSNAQVKGNISEISVLELAPYQKAEKPIIIDVRTPEETKLGIIPGAVLMNINDSNFTEKLNALDKSKSYVVYCKVGGRSGKAQTIMQKAGFKKVINLKGGYDAFKAKKP